ncbi:hypothetical protein [Maricaulis sp.]|uniref:hypothetical protein n=1 Tax=Maricaulis sp. TaxID=1486257 RepID=UPI001B0D5418|nr:hypothetical protein [Maricaulis sp.]MBO6796277.1 hypothetical protein [Maricaulis sp.]
MLAFVAGWGAPYIGSTIYYGWASMWAHHGFTFFIPSTTEVLGYLPAFAAIFALGWILAGDRVLVAVFCGIAASYGIPLIFSALSGLRLDGLVWSVFMALGLSGAFWMARSVRRRFL